MRAITVGEAVAGGAEPPRGTLDERLGPIVELLRGRRLVALTGAGCSTESGIPDYRGEGRTAPRNPILHEIVTCEADEDPDAPAGDG